MKKYVIARNRKELEKNLKYIEKEYYKEKSEGKKDSRKQNVFKSFWNRVKIAFISLRLSETYLIGEMKLYKKYIREIELYYAINDFDTDELYYIKNHKEKMCERKYSIILPLVLSIVASFGYTMLINKIVNNDNLKTLAKATKTLYWGLHNYNIDIFLKNFDVIGLLGSLYILIFVLFIMIAWIIIKAVNIFAAFCSGINYTKEMAYRYENDYIEVIIEKGNKLKKEIIKYAEELIYPISVMIENEMIKRDSYELNFYDINKTIIEWLETNPDLKEFSQQEYGRRILEVIFYRTSLLIKSKSSKVEFNEHRFCFKKK